MLASQFSDGTKKTFGDIAVLFAKSDKLTWWDFVWIIIPPFLVLACFMSALMAFIIWWHRRCEAKELNK